MAATAVMLSSRIAIALFGAEAEQIGVRPEETPITGLVVVSFPTAMLSVLSAPTHSDSPETSAERDRPRREPRTLIQRRRVAWTGLSWSRLSVC